MSWRRVADDAQDRHSAGHVRDHAADDLAGEGLAIEVALSGHDKVGDGDVFVQADEVGDELETRDDLGSERGEASGEAARGAGSGRAVTSTPKSARYAVGETGEAGGQLLDLFGRGALLWSKDPCRRPGTSSSRRRLRRARRLEAPHVNR